jgi:DNA-binding transcriptional LysR family regulator
MDTELLKTFLAVEKSKHFGRAAENLYLTPAAISARIRQLEAAVGTPLFTRHRNNVTLTEAGERLKPYAESILESWNKALQDSSHSGGHSHQLAIGGTPNVWDCVLQAYLDEIHVARPELALRAECHGSEFLTAQLQGRQLDMAILFDPLKLDGLEREQIGEVCLQLVSTEKGKDLASVMASDYVQVDWGIRFGMQHARLLPRHTRPALFTSTGRIALDFVLRHGGSLYLPQAIASTYLKEKRLFAVTGAAVITQAIHATYLKDSVKRPLVKQLTRLLKVAPAS